MSLQAGGAQRQGKSPVARRTAGFGGVEEAPSFPREEQDRNPVGATAHHLENKSILLRLK